MLLFRSERRLVAPLAGGDDAEDTTEKLGLELEPELEPGSEELSLIVVVVILLLLVWKFIVRLVV